MDETSIPLTDELNKLTDNEYKFSLKSALLDKGADFCVLEIFYRDGVLISADLKKTLERRIRELVPGRFKYEIKYIKNYVNAETVTEKVESFLRRNFASVSFKIDSVTLTENCCNIELVVDELSLEHAKEKRLDELICHNLSKAFDDTTFVCHINPGKVFVEDEQTVPVKNYASGDDQSSVRIVEFSDAVPLVGEAIDAPASYIKDKASAQQNVVLCGVVTSINSVILKKRQKKDASEPAESAGKPNESSGKLGETAGKPNETAGKPNETAGDATLSTEAATTTAGELLATTATASASLKSTSEPASEAETAPAKPEYNRKLYKFELQDFTGAVSCVFFSNKENQPKLEALKAGTKVALRGNIEDDKYSGGIVFNVHDISQCNFPDDLTEVIVYHEEKPFYEFVKPEPVVIYEQNNLMDYSLTKPVPEYLLNKTFVCYDFETTGLHFESGDKIIEIGAVKIVNGKITEKFMSYVDPEMPIPAASSAVSGIVDSDVAGAPKDYEILGDFFKFTRGAILIGYNNINFDNVFLLGQGKRCRWNFEGDTEDVYRLAQKYVHGVRNYRLGTVAERLGVSLVNAHRAVNDAMATAEVFLKIAELMEPQS